VVGWVDYLDRYFLSYGVVEWMYYCLCLCGGSCCDFELCFCLCVGGGCLSNGLGV